MNLLRRLVDIGPELARVTYYAVVTTGFQAVEILGHERRERGSSAGVGWGCAST